MVSPIIGRLCAGSHIESRSPICRIEGVPKGFPAQIGPKQMTKHGHRNVNDEGSGRQRKGEEAEGMVILKRGEIRGWFPWPAAICPFAQQSSKKPGPDCPLEFRAGARCTVHPLPEIERFLFIVVQRQRFSNVYVCQLFLTWQYKNFIYYFQLTVTDGREEKISIDFGNDTRLRK